MKSKRQNCIAPGSRLYDQISIDTGVQRFRCESYVSAATVMLRLAPAIRTLKICMELHMQIKQLQFSQERNGITLFLINPP